MTLDNLKHENLRLRRALALVVTHLENGGAVSSGCSLELLCDEVPREVLLTVRSLKRTIDMLQKANVGLVARSQRQTSTKVVEDETPKTNELLGKILARSGILHQGNAPEEWVKLTRHLERELKTYTNPADQQNVTEEMKG